MPVLPGNSTENEIEIDDILFAKAMKDAGVDINTGFSRTFASRPVNKINIPEVTNAKSTFVYNYFTRDERARGYDEDSGVDLVNLDISNTSNIFNRVVNEKIPRYVKLSFRGPPKSLGIIGQIESTSTDQKNKEILDNIVYEGGASNTVFTGVEILDTGKETKLYTMLNGAVFFSDIDPEKNSNKETIQKLHEALSQKGGLKGQDKKILIESFKNITSDGYSLARTDVSPEIAKFANDPIGKQTFSVQFNNLFFPDITSDATIFNDTVFQDEVRGLKEISSEFKETALRNIPPANTFREIEYDLQVKAVNLTAIESIGQNISEEQLNKLYPQIKFYGYVVEKFEVLPDESTRFVGRRLINGYENTYMIDDNVRYGGVYHYSIRTLCQVKSIVATSHTDDPAMDELAIAEFYAASEGNKISVECVERIPPPPPQNIRARFDFETLLPKLTWQIPHNPQQDIKRFQIFKRHSINEPFALLKEYIFDDSQIKSPSPELTPVEDQINMRKPRMNFIDTTHREGEKPIYTVACVDAHGMTSNYGPQLKVERDYHTNKVKVTIISRANAPKPYPNLFLNVDTFQDAIKVSDYDRIKIAFDPEYYDVFRTKEFFDQKQKENIIIESSMQLLTIDNNRPRYKIHLINVDNQKDQIVDLKIMTKASPGTDGDEFNVGVATFSESSLNFEF